MSDEDKGPETSTTSRRNLFLGFGALAVVATGWQVFGVRRGLSYAPHPTLEGWQQAQSALLTAPGGNATSAVFAGIGGGDDVRPLLPSALCDTLYQSSDSGVPVAVFSDFFCPNCRTLDARLARPSDLAITWHQLPLLGPSSEIVARALMAADLQGGYVAMRDQLVSRPFRPMLVNFLEAAINAGLDAERLGRDMHETKVASRLRLSRSAAETLRIWGTPSFTVGRTLVLGAVSERQLDQLIAGEGAADCEG